MLKAILTLASQDLQTRFKLESELYLATPPMGKHLLTLARGDRFGLVIIDVPWEPTFIKMIEKWFYRSV